MDARDKHFDLFLHALDHDDDLAAVVRSQVFIEQALREAIEDALENSAVIKDGTWKTMMFERRLELALATGLPITKEMVDSLKLLADFRNQLAHRLGLELTEAQVNDLYGRLPKDERQRVNRMKAKRKKPITWKALLRFCLIVIVGRTLQEAQNTRKRIFDMWRLRLAVLGNNPEPYILAGRMNRSMSSLPARKRSDRGKYRLR